MTDIRDINSTSHSKKDIKGNVVYTVRDSLLAETLFSVIMGITLLSVIMIIKSYVELIDVSMYAAFSTLTVPVLHTFVRRLRINSQFLVFLMHIAVSAAFFFIAVNIPVLQFGNSIANRFYLAAILAAMTLFSLFHRLKPAFSAADSEFIFFPAIIHIVFYILYTVAGREEFARNLMIHAIIMAILFIITRQIAVFDAKFYHSIHKTNKPSALLKKQNNKTVAGLIAVIAVSLAVLVFIPVGTLSRILMTGIRAFFGWLFSLVRLPGLEKEIELSDPMEDVNSLGPLGPEGKTTPWIEIAGTIMAVICLITVICLILNALRILVQNAPKYSKRKETLEDANLIDMVEDIRPDTKPLITRGPDFGTGYEKHVRKQFYSKVRRAMKKGLPVSEASTPGQIRTVLQANGDNDIASLVQEYEKVRYGK